MAEDVTGKLAQFASELTYDQIPERTKECTKGLLLDALAYAVAGHLGEETRQVGRPRLGSCPIAGNSILGASSLWPALPL